MKYITAEGPSSELLAGRNGEIVPVENLKLTGHTYPAAREPVQFQPVWVKPDGDGWDLTEHVICPVCGDRTLYERGHFPPSKVLCEHQTAQNETEQLRAQLETAREAGEAIDALCKEINLCPMVDDRETIKALIYAEAQPLREQLETARKALADIQEYIDTADDVKLSRIYTLAQIGAGQKGGK